MTDQIPDQIPDVNADPPAPLDFSKPPSILPRRRVFNEGF